MIRPESSVAACLAIISLSCTYCAPRGIRTPNRQIRRLVLSVHAVRPSALRAAQVRCRIQLGCLSVSGDGWWTATRTADVELLAFEAGCEDYCEREVDEVEWQGGRVYLHLGARRDDLPRG
jgi:hypothetical protein